VTDPAPHQRATAATIALVRRALADPPARCPAGTPCAQTPRRPPLGLDHPTAAATHDAR